jgi:hypothetical protein
MKLIDYLVIASFPGCMFIGYSGHRARRKVVQAQGRLFVARAKAS